MTTSYDLPSAEDFAAVLDGPHEGTFTVRVYERDGTERDLVTVAGHDEAWRIHDQLVDTLATWEGWTR